MLDLRIVKGVIRFHNTKAPSAIDEKLYDELHLRVVGGEEE